MMIKLLSLLSFVRLFAFVASAENNDAVAVEKTALELNYGVVAFECNDKLEMIVDQDDKSKKIIGTVHRICFEPNQVASEAGVGIKKINSWEWETSYDGGVAVQTAVTDGNGVGGLSHVECQDGGKICLLDTMLTTDFYQNAGSVLGKGEASFTAGTGTVVAKKDLFQVGFTMKFTNSDGEEMNDEETAELLKQVDEHNSAVTAGESDEETNTEDVKTTDEVKEEL